MFWCQHARLSLVSLVNQASGAGQWRVKLRSGDKGTCHEDQEMEEIIPTETVSETAQSRPRSFSPRLETSGGGQTPASY